MAWNLPLTQSVHTKMDDEGELYFPTAQFVHEDKPEVEDFPSAQSEHDEEPAEALIFPASQAVQVVKSVIL